MSQGLAALPPAAANRSAADPFTENVLCSLPEEVRGSFSEAQLRALRGALSRVHDSSRHLVDARLVLPLYFTRIYVVFLLGKDRRRETQEVLVQRRKKAGRTASLAALTLLLWTILCISLVTAFLVIYVFKCALGIDLFPDSHLADWVRLLFGD